MRIPRAFGTPRKAPWHVVWRKRHSGRLRVLVSMVFLLFASSNFALLRSRVALEELLKAARKEVLSEVSSDG